VIIPRKPPLVDLLATARVANLPTVWTNVLVGFLLGSFAGSASEFEAAHGPAAYLLALLAVLLSASLLHVGGCFLHDWHDAEWNGPQRPERPIPSGRLSRRFVLITALACLLGALILSFLLSPAALVLSLCIILCIFLYTILHKRTHWAFFFMGGARALLYLLGFFVVSRESDLWKFFDPSPAVQTYQDWRAWGSPAGSFSLWEAVADDPILNLLLVVIPCFGLLAYILGLSLAARFEAVPEAANRVLAATPALFLFVPILTHSHWWTGDRERMVLIMISALPFLAWTLWNHLRLRRRADVGEFVSLSLAGICLVDLALVLPYATIDFFDSPFGDDLTISLAATTPLPLFALALILQRIAPAT